MTANRFLLRSRSRSRWHRPRSGKGYAIAHEIADLLEATSRVDPSKVDLSAPAYETDVLVIGGGGAGTSAAILAAEQGARVIMATKLRHGDANTMMAEGGIQAATKGHKDSPSTSRRSRC